MHRALASNLLTFLRRYLLTAEAVVLAASVAAVELLGPYSRSDVDDIPWVLFYPLLFMTACSAARYRALPITRWLLERMVRCLDWAKRRLVVSLGLDFHPERHPHLPPFLLFHRACIALCLTAAMLAPTRGLARELLVLSRSTGIYTLYVALLGLVWVALLAGLALQVPAAVLGTIETVRHRLRLRSGTRLAAGALLLVGMGVLMVFLHGLLGLEGCLGLLALGALLPSVLRPVEPLRAPWLAVALGSAGSPGVLPLSRLVSQTHRLIALLAFLVVCLLAPSSAVDADGLLVTNALVAVYGWSAAWLVTVGAVSMVTELNRRRRRNDPALERERVLWAAPGPEAAALENESAAIRRAGWRLVRSARLPGVEEADLLVGVPPDLALRSGMPVAQVPPALFLLSDDPGAVLSVAEERDKAQRARVAIERLLAGVRPHMAGRGDGTFIVPHCWMVVGLTRDEERGSSDRPAAMTFGQSYRLALGTRLRRFLFEVFDRASVDVLYVEDAVTPQQLGDVLDHFFEHHVRRAEPPQITDRDFLGVQGVRVVFHDVDPGSEGIPGVDTGTARGAVSRARIMIISRDRREGDDDDGPPTESESSDSWLRETLTRLFPRVQPA